MAWNPFWEVTTRQVCPVMSLCKLNSCMPSPPPLPPPTSLGDHLCHCHRQQHHQCAQRHWQKLLGIVVCRPVWQNRPSRIATWSCHDVPAWALLCVDLHSRIDHLGLKPGAVMMCLDAMFLVDFPPAAVHIYLSPPALPLPDVSHETCLPLSERTLPQPQHYTP